MGLPRTIRLLWALLLVAGQDPTTARASGPLWGPPRFPKLSLAVGGSAGALLARDVQAGSVNVEVTGGWTLGWLSAGLRTTHQPESSHLLPYVEAGVWFFVNVGVGYAAAFNLGPADAPRLPRHNVVLFAGFPFPVWIYKPSKKRLRLLFLEPYYRAQWGAGDGARGWSHEIGLQFKWLAGWGYMKGW